MKPRLLSSAAAFLTLAASLLAGPRDDLWKKVDAATKQQLPKTAIEELEPIIADALADQHYAEATRALTRKIVLEGQIQGNRPEERIVRLEAEVAKAPAAMQPVMEAILAHWYWDYFQDNRWRFLQRTQTATAPGADLQAWDLARILAEIDQHFTAALADPAALQKIPISDFDDLLDKGTVPDSYRPTLYDFLAYQALLFYQAGEQGQVRAEDAFELDAESPVFSPTPEFLRWQPATPATPSPLLKAVSLYQALLRFHQKDADRSAYLDADLERLSFGYNSAVGETKDERCQDALQRFSDKNAKHEISARALAMLARQLHQAGDSAQAHALAQRGLAAFPKTAGGDLCFNVIQEIEQKTAEIVTEFVWNAPSPTVNVTYRNLTKVHFRAVPLALEEYLNKKSWRYGQMRDEEREALLRLKPVLTWSADLPATTDFKERTAPLAAPASLAPGYYAIIASGNRDFTTEENQVSIAQVWVSDLALIMDTDRNNQALQGFVLNATTGEPLANATVQAWLEDKSRWAAAVKSDANGRFEIPTGERETVILARHHGQSVSTIRPVYNYQRNEDEPSPLHTVFFTDRALYRPGQTISYKGISYRAEPAKHNYTTLAHTKVEVVFQDPNGKEIARASHVTNDFGSFSGVFTAPRDRLMGSMGLWVIDGPEGETAFNVEEYKRPKFEVAFSAPVEAAKLEAQVEVAGRASAYTGAAIGGAKVKWHVARQTRLPFWCWWWQPPGVNAIAHGTTVTEPDGTFKVQFTAVPDHTIPEKLEPVFSYSVHADVTDTTGETRSASRVVAAGYTALQAAVSAGEWQIADKPVELLVSTASLDGDPQAATGTLVIRALQPPAQVARAALAAPRVWGKAQAAEPPVDPANPDSWALGVKVATLPFQTDAEGEGVVATPLKAGMYRADLETKDRFGKRVTSRRTIEVLDPASPKYGVKQPNQFVAPTWSVEPGGKFTALWGTGYDFGRAFVEVECDGQTLQAYWTPAGRTQSAIEVPITEAMRGGFKVRATYVRENRAYLNAALVDVPWSDKQLAVKWESFRSKLMPGQQETWTATITGADGKHPAIEMVAALYDISLDQFRPHAWREGFEAFRAEVDSSTLSFQNGWVGFMSNYGGWEPEQHFVDWRYRALPPELVAPDDEMLVLSAFTVASRETTGYAAASTLAGGRAKTGGIMGAMRLTNNEGINANMPMAPAPTDSPEEASTPQPNLDQVTARKNLNETAFFSPHLLSDRDGTVKLQFTMPEALTKWKFLGFAHNQQLKAGLLTGEAVTAKDLMVEPNPPRFVREGDAIEFTVKVSNQSDQPQSGQVRLTFADAATLASADAALGNHATEQSFEIPARQSRSYSWRVAVPDGMGFLTYKAVGATGKASDGEEGFLPVLSRRILVMESLPLPIRGPVTKEFDFKKLLESGQSDTLRHQSLTVQMVSQPAWYAVMALPYLMEFPHECSEQLFNRYYANALARHIAGSDPKIRRIFDLWKGTPALDSPLTKNQDLKAVLLEETPWLRSANRESEARRNVGLLFDDNRLNEEAARNLQQLAERQLGDGLWAWFPGGRANEYISLYIVTGFGRLRHLGADVDLQPALKSLAGLDAWMDARHREIQRHPHPEKYRPSSTEALYLYGRSFYLKDRPIAPEHQVAVNFFLNQARKYWTDLGSRQSQAHLALALQRFGDQTVPQAIVKSLKERSVSNEELGMFWRDTESGWWWYQAPIETQAMMIEAFAEVTHDDQAVADCQVWLLKQKQTQDWKTTKATADAIYSLLLKGENLLASDALVEVSLGGTPIKPEKVEAGTGFYEQKFAGAEIKPAMGHITVKKVDAGVSWGSAHWQYLEDTAKVTPHEGTPLTLKKSLWIKETTKQGPVLQPVTGPIAVGDELVVRVELRTDRDMEYVHLKDQRGSGTEPVSVLSRYKYQDGLGYYESTRDTASHFYIEYLPKGTYVFEYSTRVQLKGSYQSGIAEIQCMYAPEFNSHSASVLIEVR